MPDTLTTGSSNHGLQSTALSQSTHTVCVFSPQSVSVGCGLSHARDAVTPPKQAAGRERAFDGAQGNPASIRPCSPGPAPRRPVHPEGSASTFLRESQGPQTRETHTRSPLPTSPPRHWRVRASCTLYNYELASEPMGLPMTSCHFCRVNF